MLPEKGSRRNFYENKFGQRVFAARGGFTDSFSLRKRRLMPEFSRYSNMA